MALSHIFVDPLIGTDTGLGTLINPFGNIEYGIRQTTFDTVNGTQVNVKFGAVNIVTADLEVSFADTSVTPAWASTITAPIVVRGYTFAANDWTMGDISGGDSVSVFAPGASGRSYVNFINMRIHNSGTNSLINMNDYSSLQYCHLYGLEGSNLYLAVVDNYSLVQGCYFVSDGATKINGLHMDNGTIAVNNYFDFSQAPSSTNTIVYAYTSTHANRNIVISPSGHAGTSILLINGSEASHNSIYCVGGGTGTGLSLSQSTNAGHAYNNLIQGYNGVAGDGMTINNLRRGIYGNGVFDCTTPYIFTGADVSTLDDNEILTASPFTDAANFNFIPVDIGNVKEGGLPNIIGGGLV